MNFLEGVVFSDTRPNKRFIENYFEKYGSEPMLEAHTGYEILKSMAKAFRENRNNPAAGIRKVKYQGVAGEIDYSEGCSGNKADWHLFQIQGGKSVVLE